MEVEGNHLQKTTILVLLQTHILRCTPSSQVLGDLLILQQSTEEDFFLLNLDKLVPNFDLSCCTFTFESLQFSLCLQTYVDQWSLSEVCR